METRISKTTVELNKIEFSSFAEMSMSAYAKEEPIAYRIVRSGWSKPPMYHVLVEFGDYGDTTYKGVMTAEQIKSELGFVMIEHPSVTDYVIKYPNNMDLGKELRHVANQYKQTTKI
jgi:hypothetical protein